MKQSENVQRLFQMMILTLVLLGTCGFHWWDPIAQWIGIGNQALESGDLDKADQAYAKAADKSPGDDRILNNQGIVQYSREDYEKAAKLFDAAVTSQDPQVKSQALYNRGCAHLQKGDLAGAAESFIEALKVNPDDEDSKANLEIALQMLQQMPTPTPQSQDQDQNQDQNDQQPSGTPDTNTPTPDPNRTQSPSEEPSDENQTPTATPEGQNQSESDGTVTPTPSGSPTAEPQPQPEQTAEPAPEDGMMSVSEAERLLDAQEEEEMDVRRRFHQLPQVKDRAIEKDW